MTSFSCVYHRLHSSLSSSLRSSSGPAKQSYAALWSRSNLDTSISRCGVRLSSFTDLKAFTSTSLSLQKESPRHPRPLHTAAALNSAAPHPAAALTDLAPGHVHIWWLHLGQSGEECAEAVERYKAVLPDSEVEECGGVGPVTTPQAERLIARGFLRSVLAQYLAGEQLCASSLQFKKNSHGKPDMEWPRTTPSGHRLRFNLTHTGGLVGVAVTVEALVGLDVEIMGRKTKRDPLKLAARRFSEVEVAELKRHDDITQQSRHFMHIWTLKESYVKALGRGISAPPGLASFSFLVDPIPAAGAPQESTISFMSAVDDEKRWQFLLIEPTWQHIAALSVEQQAGGPRSGVQLTSFEGHLIRDGPLGVISEPKIIAMGNFMPEE